MWGYCWVLCVQRAGCVYALLRVARCCPSGVCVNWRARARVSDAVLDRFLPWPPPCWPTIPWGRPASWVRLPCDGRKCVVKSSSLPRATLVLRHEKVGRSGSADFRRSAVAGVRVAVAERTIDAFGGSYERVVGAPDRVCLSVHAGGPARVVVLRRDQRGARGCRRAERDRDCYSTCCVPDQPAPQLRQTTERQSADYRRRSPDHVGA